MYKGKLTVCTGSMFSGKSTELQRLGKRRELAGHIVYYYKPSIDNRFGENSITTHDKRKITAVEVENIEELFDDIFLKNELKPNLVCIDEIQFFETEHTVTAIEQILGAGIDVVVAGLDMDRNGQPFGAMPYLLCQAEDVRKFNAVCVGCGDDGWISYSEMKVNSQILVGEKEIYQPLCRTCYHEKIEKGKSK